MRTSKNVPPVYAKGIGAGQPVDRESPIVFRGSRPVASKTDRSTRYAEVGAGYINVVCRVLPIIQFLSFGESHRVLSDIGAVTTNVSTRTTTTLTMTYSLRICFCLLLAVGCSWALPSGMDSQAVGHNSIQGKEDLLDGIYNECLLKGSVECVKYKLFAYVDKALNKDEINLTEGVTVVRTSGNPGDGAPRSLDGGEDQPKDMESLVVKRVQRYLNEHSIKVDIKGSDVVNAVSRAGKSVNEIVSKFVGEEENSAEESRGKKSK